MINPFVQPNIKSLNVDSSGRQSSEPVLQQAPVDIQEGTIFNYEQLRTSKGVEPPKGINLENREKYLSDTEFESLFKMKKDKFKELPEWKKKKLKQDLELF